MGCNFSYALSVPCTNQSSFLLFRYSAMTRQKVGDLGICMFCRSFHSEPYVALLESSIPNSCTYAGALPSLESLWIQNSDFDQDLWGRHDDVDLLPSANRWATRVMPPHDGWGAIRRGGGNVEDLRRRYGFRPFDLSRALVWLWRTCTDCVCTAITVTSPRILCPPLII